MSDVKRITVIGAGTMGHGIAHVSSAVGYDVVLHDVSAERVEKGLEAIRASLAKGIAKGKVSPEQREATLSGIYLETDDATGLATQATSVRIGGRLSHSAPA